MPNLLLSGAPGIGKTTSIGCLATELLLQAFPEITDPAAISEIGAQQDQAVCAEEAEFYAAGHAQADNTRRGGQYDDGRAASPAPHYGDIQQHDAVCNCVQFVVKNHRTDTEQMCVAKVCEAGQPAGDQQAGGDIGERGGDQQPAGDVPRDGPDQRTQCVPDL
ncbi:hypothetical protein AYI69_g9307 [Smittium culicis]|uniref:Uncharacterized protein n=1 Tax=Smittium culicis TaxID=133412 RepID=A0A1R1XDG4_9FUNG|nr:hypothetical protein AYI69_g9307 [Smittium culicis]